MSKEKGLKRKREVVEKSGSKLLEDYPWLRTFDTESKTCLTNPDMEITSRHVLKLVTFLETKISPEVSRLKTKPNRATKFLFQIRKRIICAKMSGWLTREDIERQLLPTFGLLLMHYVNISLVSSILEKSSSQEVATDLYCMLKLMFQLDYEYVLDVVLCSNLAENASTKEDAGFHIFSFIVDDWRSYSSKESAYMKYCYVAALLSESTEGNRLIERDLPSETSKSFIEYLNSTLDMKLKVSKNHLLSNIVQQIKPKRAIIKMSRSRLVIVSERTLSKGIISRLEEDSDEDSESSGSTMLASSSGTKSQEYHVDSSQSNDLGFCLDTTASYHNNQDEWGDKMFEDYDSKVSSSTNKRRRNVSGCSTDTLTIKRSAKTKKNSPISTIEEEQEDEEIRSSEQEARRTHRSRKSSSKNVEIAMSLRSQSLDVEVGDRLPPCPNVRSELIQRELIGKELREELDAEIDSDHHGGHDEDESDVELDEEMKEIGYEKTEVEDDIGRKKQHHSKKIVSESEDDDEKDSDLEVLSETVVQKDPESDDMSCSGNERDEAEAESGEDVVPNYDEDSDDDDTMMDIDEQGQNQSSETVVVPRTSSSSKDTSNSTVDDNESHQDEVEPPSSQDDSAPGNDGEESGNESEVGSGDDTQKSETEAATSTNPTSTPYEFQDSDSVVLIPIITTNGTTSPIRSPDTIQPQASLLKSGSVRTRSSSASPMKTRNLNDHDEESKSQLSIQSQVQSTKTARGRKKANCATAPITTEVSCRRITRALACTNPETSTNSTSLRSQVVRGRRPGRGRGRGMASTSKE